MMTGRHALVCVVVLLAILHAAAPTGPVPSVDRLDAALRANSPDVWSQDLGWPASVNSNCCPAPLPGVAVESVKRITPDCSVQCPYTTQYKKKRRNICYHASMKAGTSTTATYLHRVTDAAVKHLGYTITEYKYGPGPNGGWTVLIDHEKKTLAIHNLWKHYAKYGECETVISIRDPRDQIVSLMHYYKTDVWAPRIKYGQWKTEASIPAVALLKAVSPLENNENSTAGIQLLPFALLKENMFTLLSQVTLFAGFDLTHANFTNGVMEAEMQGVADELKKLLEKKKQELDEKQRYETRTRFRSGKIGGFHNEPDMTPDRIAELEFFVSSMNPLFPQWYPFEYITCDVTGVTGPVWPDRTRRCRLKEGVTGLSASSRPELWQEHLKGLNLELHPWQGAVIPPQARSKSLL